MSYIPPQDCKCNNMHHDYKYENMAEEDRNALIPYNRRKLVFADYEKPVFDGPQPNAPLPNLNTENAGE